MDSPWSRFSISDVFGVIWGIDHQVRLRTPPKERPPHLGGVQC